MCYMKKYGRKMEPENVGKCDSNLNFKQGQFRKGL